MREKVFRRPSVREVLEFNRIEIPARVNFAYLFQLLNKGFVKFAGHSYEEAVEVVGSLDEGQIALFSSRFRITAGDSNQGIKSLDELAKIDSQEVLRQIAGSDRIPPRLTRQFLEEYQKYPRSYIRRATDSANIESPPMGFYWVGSDGHARATTWIRAAAASEMERMKQTGDFPPARILDKNPWGRNIRVSVASRTEEGKSYDYSWTRIPAHKRGDLGQYSCWIDMACSSNDPDMVFRGEMHNKRVPIVHFFSSGAIYALHEATRFIAEHPEWKQVRMQVFPIPSNRETTEHIDKLRLQSLILDEEEGKLHLSVLNKSEMDKQIGARTIKVGYNNCWYHWGKKDTSYLYTPKK